MRRLCLRRSRAAVMVGLVALVSALVACSTEVEVRTSGADLIPTPAAGADDRTDSDGAPPAPAAGADESSADGAGGAGQGADGPLRTPARGEALAVVGVAFDQTVAVRAAARPRARVVTQLPALFDQAIGTGQGRSDATTDWWQILVGDELGWVDASAMARLGATNDVTDEVVAALGETPGAPTMGALGRLVAEARLGDETAQQARVVRSGAPTVGEVGEVVYDIVGRGDDSVAGERLVVFATPDGDGFVLRSVESTVFCARGVTADGRCT